MIQVSVALCTFNGQDFLADQLSSFLSQTKRPDEVIISDDGSSDRTVAIAREFRAIAPFPVFIHENRQNIGTVRNFEKAISICSGDVIFLCDQDDVWLPQKIEQTIDIFDRLPDVDLVFSDAHIVDRNLNDLGRNLWDSFDSGMLEKSIRRGDAPTRLVRGEFITGATMAVRDRLAKYCLPFPIIEQFIHDGWIAFAGALVSKIYMLDKPLVKYRQHGSQQIGAGAAAPRSHYLKSVGRKRGFARWIGEIQHDLKLCEILRNICTDEPYESFAMSKVSSKPRISHEQLMFLESRLSDSLVHFRFRGNLPDNMGLRIKHVIGEFLKGRYYAYSRGLRSAVADIAFGSK